MPRRDSHDRPRGAAFLISLPRRIGRSALALRAGFRADAPCPDGEPGLISAHNTVANVPAKEAR
ncbi:hypothetical protein Misp02_12910 [Microtetraspora sp. NBRC 16547]|nr:hypothetical protein Misp02_12910 [Microtetraspora sp. NBRC 16547]